MQDGNLQGKVALVTGGSRGLGAASARRLASAGADVAVGYVKSVDKADVVVAELAGLGVHAAAFRADQGERDEAVRMVAEVVDRFGRIDVLVNSAGVFAAGPLGALSPKDVARLWAVNVFGMVAVTEQAVAHMPDGGRVINISSTAGERAFVGGLADYSASKAAMNAYGRSWAHELAPRRITVNTVVAGFSETDMRIPEDSDLGRTAIGLLPFHRYATPEDVAAAVAFLAAPEASYVTGAALRVDGGWNA